MPPPPSGGRASGPAMPVPWRAHDCPESSSMSNVLLNVNGIEVIYNQIGRAHV